ncbi:NLR family CARD domain-containing protein 3-like isoform 3-T4 [Synchiropus picturatus]
MFVPINFKSKDFESSQMDKESGAPSCHSLKSEASMFVPMYFRSKDFVSSQMDKESGAPSCHSLKSEASMFVPMYFRSKDFESSQKIKESEAPSCHSLKSEASMFVPMYFKNGGFERKFSEDLNDCVDDRPQSTRLVGYEKEDEPQMVSAEEHLKFSFREKFYSWGDVCDPENDVKHSYTDVIMTGEAQEMPEKHVVRLNRALWEENKSQTNKFLASLDHILKRQPGREKPNRTVVTEGVAGIGKTFSVQKFILNWVEGKTNTDINFVFSFAFRELNLIKGQRSLHKLVTDFHPALRGITEPDDLNRAKVIVILDGLDESRFLLDFEAAANITSVSKASSLSNLVVNLIKGSLLPDAQLWITTRSVVSNRIPSKYVDVVTEITGFSDSQKEEYFRRRFSSDPDTAEEMISHVQSSAAFSAMCQIPLFSSISALLFEQNSGGCYDPESPHTLTEMMAHFLLAQTKLRWRKYGWGRHRRNSAETHRDFLHRLCKLAFVQLEKNKLIFDEMDLEQCGIDLSEAIIFSGFCSGILRGKDVFCQRTVFFFVHVIIQEFFAALYVFHCFMSRHTAELEDFLGHQNQEYTHLDLLKLTVEKVFEKGNGQFNFFLQFLLGLLVESNYRILKDLIGSPELSTSLVMKMQTHLKAIQGNISPRNCIILSKCLVEMRDPKGSDHIPPLDG